ncbi:tetratricopeptide repeat protein [Actinomyces slackii]|nr:tetratricopeptide repeat protein [Actinomyces slackii]
MVLSRYNAPDSWGRDTVWLAPVEELRRFIDPSGSLLPDATGPCAAPARVSLRIDDHRVHLTCAELGIDLTADHDGPDADIRWALEELARNRHSTRYGHSLAARESSQAVSEGVERVGRRLSELFVSGEMSEALRGILRQAEAGHQPVLLALDLSAAGQELRALPWESLWLAGESEPVALHYLVALFRRAGSGAEPHAVEGPLTIVVAIASPIEGGGAPLDYQSELRNILEAVHSARGAGARVRIIHFATTEAIRRALDEGDVHVLHISAHGSAGHLLLEDEDSRARKVTAAEFVREAIPAGMMPPVICLAACETSLSGQAEIGSFADGLADAGAPAVVGTTSAISDRYATLVFASLYRELASASRPETITALAHARRSTVKELDRSKDPRNQDDQVRGDWSVVTATTARWENPLPITRSSGPSLPSWGSPSRSRRIGELLTLEPGDFVGRRREQHEVPRLLLSPQCSGVVLQGIGGVGKTTLATEVIRRLTEIDPSTIIVPLKGMVTADQVLQATASALCKAFPGQEDTGFNQLLNHLRSGDLRWQDRLEVLSEQVLDEYPVILVLDNAEDNLLEPGEGSSHRELRDSQLAEFLTAWGSDPGRGGMLITCRYPFELTGLTGMETRQVPPLSWPETLHMVWALPQLAWLPWEDLHTLWSSVGGHPRTLETVDALLVHGAGRLRHVTDRLRTALDTVLAGSDTTPAQWLAQERTLDSALADAVTVAADDIILPELLETLTAEAHRLLAAVSVFTEPIPLEAIAFVSRPQAASAGTDEDAQWLTQWRQTPESDSLIAQLDELCRSSLLTEIKSSKDSAAPPQWFVHRWTATALERVWEQAEESMPSSASRHERAARYWLTRFRVTQQGQEADAHDLLLVRDHRLAAGDVEGADSVSQKVVSRMITSGMWDDAASLARQQLNAAAPGSVAAAEWSQRLGDVFQKQGYYQVAQDHYHQSLTTFRELDDKQGAAQTFGNLGRIAQLQGEYSTAEDLYHQSLTTFRELGDKQAAAQTLNNLGNLTQLQGEYSKAQDLYHQSLTTFRELGDKQGATRALGNLGKIAQLQGEYSTAEDLYHQSLTTFRELGDKQGTAQILRQLGILARLQGDYPTAEDLYHQSLTTFRELGDKQGATRALGNLGNLAHDQGEYSKAQDLYHQSLTTFRELGDKQGATRALGNLGNLAHDQGEYSKAQDLYHQSLAIFRELGDKHSTATTLHNLGTLAHSQSEHSVAHECFKEALMISEEINYLLLMRMILQDLAILIVDHPQDEYVLLLHSHTLSYALLTQDEEMAKESCRALHELARTGNRDVVREYLNDALRFLDEESRERLIAGILNEE